MQSKPTFNAGRTFGQKDSGTLGQETVTRLKGQPKSLPEQHAETLKNIQSTNIGKPTIVEAQRILKIIEELQYTWEIFQYLDADFVGKFFDLQKGKMMSKELVNQLSPQCKELLKEEAEIEARFKQYAQFEQQKENEEEKNQEERNQEEDQQKLLEKEKTYKQLEINFKNLLRYVKEHSDDYKIIRDLKPNLNQEILDLKHCIECWRIIYLKKLSTASEEQESHVKQAEQLTESIKRLKGNKESCEKELKKLRQRREQFQRQKKEEVEKLKSEIQEVKLTEQKDQKKLEEMIEQQKKQRNKEHEQKISDYNRTILECKELFEQEKKKNADEEDKLKKAKQRSENMLAENINVYDNMMDEKMQEKKELEEDLDKIKKELYHLKKHFKKIEEERAREEEVDNIFRQKRDKWDIHEKRKHAAASHVQIAFKRFKESKGKKKKRGKKKK